MKETYTLYKRDKLKRIQVWSIQTEGDHFRTIEGLLDGNKTTSEWTFAVGKNIGKANETTDAQQALKEANSRIAEKKKQGYVEKLEDVDKPREREEPMLAEEWKDYGQKLLASEKGIASQPKLDGVRCKGRKDGLFTRTGEPINVVPSILKEVQDILKDLPDDYELDGELYNHELKDDFDRISGLCRKKSPTPEQIEESESILQYHVYDLDNKHQTFAQRSAALVQLLDRGNEDSKLRFVDTVFINHSHPEETVQSCLDSLYEKYLEEGYEGQMIRVADSLYEKRRTKSLLKRKEFMDTEFELIQVIEGSGNRANMAGAVRCRMSDGRTFRAGVKGGYTYYRKLWQEREQWIGRMVTILFQNYTPDKDNQDITGLSFAEIEALEEQGLLKGGKPRFPRMKKQ